MHGLNGRNLLLITACCSLACSSNDGADSTEASSPPQTGTLLKGHAVFGHEVRTIQPCGENDAVWAIDSTRLLWDLHQELAPGLEPYEEVFVAVQGISGEPPSDGFGADYAGSFYVERVLYAAGEGWGCNLDLSRFQFRLAGNEPFWTLVLTDSTAELSRMDAPGQAWSELEAEATHGGFRYVGGSGGSGPLEVSISEEPCHDVMSGAYHAYSASVAVNGELLTGCAIRGTAS